MPLLPRRMSLTGKRNKDSFLPGPLARFYIFLLAASLFLQACSSDPAKGIFEKAEDQLAKGDYKAALENYGKIIGKHLGSPFAPKSQFRIGNISEKYLFDSKRALQDYTYLCYIFPDSAEAIDARLEMGRIYSVLGESPKAIEQYQAALEKRPAQRDSIQYLIAMEYFKMNDFRQARIEFEELLERTGQFSGKRPEILFQIANTFYVEGDPAQAVESFDRLLEEFPLHRLSLEAKLNKARALGEMGKNAQALSILKELEAVYPNKEALKASVGSIKAPEER